jgi:hypothetical protein
MGVVYLAQDLQLQRPVALKVPSFTGKESPDVIERFYREARAAATLDHPSLCPVYDVGNVNGVHYLTMPYIEGKPLSEAIRPGRPIPLRQVAAVIRGIALAVHEAHERGVIHRDLKPANIMATRRRGLVVMDFGLARRIDLEDSRLTTSGEIMGTPGYMSPEQIRGGREVGPTSDIYSLGVIMYELLAGRRPVSGTPLAVIAQVLAHHFDPPSLHRPDLDPALEAICLKAMASEPRARHASMAEFATDLQRYIEAAGSAPERGSPDLVNGSGHARLASSEAAASSGAETFFGQFLGRIGNGSLVIDVGASSQLSRRQPAGSTARWLLGIAMGVAGTLLLGVILYVETDEGIVRVTIDVPRAVVVVDGREIHVDTPETRLTLRRGMHRIEARRGDGITVGQTIEVGRRSDVPVRLGFPPAVLAKEQPLDRPPWIAAVAGRDVPPTASEAKSAATKLLNELKTREAEKKLGDRGTLAREFFESSTAPTMTPIERYARLRLALQFAGEAADYLVAMDACAALEKWFKIDLIREKFELIEGHARFASSPQAFDNLAMAAVGVGFEALGLEDYRFADALVRLAEEAAQKSEVEALMDDAAFLKEETEAARDGYSRIKPRVEALRRDPGDPAANAAVGRFLCLVKNDWEQGRPMLIRGNHARLKALAEREVRALEAIQRRETDPKAGKPIPEQVLDWISLGNAWWSLTHEEDPDAPRARRRARFWYLKAVAVRPTPIVGGILSDLRKRLAQVPSRPFRLRLRRRGLDYDNLRFNSDRLRYARTYGPTTPLYLNHLPIVADGPTPREWKNTGATRFLPDDVDLSKVVIAEVRDIGNSKWFNHGQFFFQSTEEDVRLDIAHWPFSNFSADILLTFGISADGKDLAVAPRWKVDFFVSQKPEKGLADWQVLFKKPPTSSLLDQEYLHFDWRDWEPGPGLPRDFFGVVATTEADLPPGDYLLRIRSDDGARVLVDGREVLNGWPDPMDAEATYTSPGGRHAIRVEYLDYWHSANLYFRIMKK